MMVAQPLPFISYQGIIFYLKAQKENINQQEREKEIILQCTWKIVKFWRVSDNIKVCDYIIFEVIPSDWVTALLRTISEDSSVAQLCPTLCDPMNHSMPGLPGHHQLPEFTETHVHRISDAIQPSHPLSSPSPPAPNPSQHQSLFQ